MPTTVINSNATTQIKLGGGRIWNIIVSDPGATWVMKINDGPDFQGNARTLNQRCKNQRRAAILRCCIACLFQGRNTDRHVWNDPRRNRRSVGLGDKRCQQTSRRSTWN